MTSGPSWKYNTALVRGRPLLAPVVISSVDGSMSPMPTRPLVTRSSQGSTLDAILIAIQRPGAVPKNDA